MTPDQPPRPTTELAIREPALGLVGEFTCTACPVQAEGSIASHTFYFRARWDRWSFAVSLSPSVDPVDVSSASQGFFRESKYGSGDSDAGYMPLEEARAVVLRCAREYLIEHPHRRFVLRRAECAAREGLMPWLWIGLVVVIVAGGAVLWRRGRATPSMAMWTDISETIPRLQSAAATNIHQTGEDRIAAAAMAKQTAVLRETIRFIYTIERDGDRVSHVVSSQLVARKPEKYQVESMLVAMLALTRQLKAAGIEGDQGRFEVNRSAAGTHFMGLQLTAAEHERFMSAASAGA